MSLFSSFGHDDVWSLAGIAFSNPLSDLLDKENFSLEDLLSEDELLQELKSRNVKIVDFLSKKEVVSQLISYVTVPQFDQIDDNKKFRFPYISCEVICCENPDILNSILNEENYEHVKSLFSIIEGPLDNYLAGYFEKILEVLFRTKTLLMMDYINGRGQELLNLFLSQISNYSIMQIIQRLLLPHIPFYSDIVGEQLSESQRDKSQCKWSFNYETSRSLIVLMTTTPNHDIIVNIADLLITVIQLSPADAPILKFICEPELLSLLWNALKNSEIDNRPIDESIFSLDIAVVSVLECILARLYETAAQLVYDGAPTNQLKTIKASFQNILVNVHDVLPVMKNNIEKTLSNSATFRQPVLGQLNFFYSKLIEGLLRLGDDDVDSSLCSSGILDVVIDLVFAYPSHSMLHLSVQRMMLIILDDFTHRKLVCNTVFVEYKFIEKIQDELAKAVNVPIASRAALVGHLIVVAQAFNSALKPELDDFDLDKIESFDSSDKKKTMQDSLSSNFDLDRWNKFTETTLFSLSTANSSAITIEEVPESSINQIQQSMKFEKNRQQGDDEEQDDNEDWYDSPPSGKSKGINVQQPEIIESWNANFENIAQSGDIGDFAAFDNWGEIRSDSTTQATLTNSSDIDPFANVTDPFSEDCESSIDSLITP